MLSFCELLKERLRRIELEGQSWFADCDRGRLLAHLLALEVALEGIEEEAIMRHAVPVKDLLFLLCTDAIVLI